MAYGDFQRDPAETAALQGADYLQLIQELQNPTGLFNTTNMGLRPSEFTPKMANIPAFESSGMTPEQWLGTYYNTPSHGSDFLSNAPIIGAALFGGAAAGGLFDPSSLGAGGATGAAAAPTATLGGAGTTLEGVSAIGGAGAAPIASEFSLGGGATGYGVGGNAAIPGATGGGIGGAGTGAMAGAAGSLIPGIPNNIAAGVGQGILGYLGADKVSDAFRDVSNQNLAIGAPFRGRLEQSYAPGFSLWDQPGYADAIQRTADVSARAANVQYGNPYDAAAQGNIQRDTMNQAFLPALANYRGQLGQFGGLGLNTAGMAQLGGASQAGGGLDAIGYGLGTIFNPQPNLNDILRQLQPGQQPNFSLNIGGNLFGRG